MDFKEYKRRKDELYTNYNAAVKANYEKRPGLYTYDPEYEALEEEAVALSEKYRADVAALEKEYRESQENNIPNGDKDESRETNSLDGANPKSQLQPQIRESQIPETSYLSILQSLQRWRQSAFAADDPYDFPGHTFFKILFHFNNGGDVDILGTPSVWEGATAAEDWNAMTGLLAPSWLLWNENPMQAYSSAQNDMKNLWQHTTAWSYFVMNDDYERAQWTAQFVELLSNINSQTPWYFQKISGLTEAITRELANFGGERDFSLKNEKSSITIECLEDSYDQRIGTLLDLYRAITWSWETKREILPVNLRKFDMTIVQFQLPVRGIEVPSDPISQYTKNTTGKGARYRATEIVDDAESGGYRAIYSDGLSLPASYKAFEFHGCQFDYNSSATGMDALDNNAGNNQTYTIKIFFDNMMEIRNNAVAGGIISDMASGDLRLYSGEDIDRVNQSDPVKITPGFQSYSKAANSKEGNNVSPLSTLKNNTVNNKAKLYKQGNNGVIEGWPGKQNRSSSLVGQLLSPLKNYINNKINRVYLGNLYGFSLADLGRQINQALSGDLWATVDNIKGYVKGDNLKMGNIFDGDTPNSVMRTITNSQ